MKSIFAWTVLVILPLYVAAHSKPTSPEEIEVHRRLQAAAYYVRPHIQIIWYSDLLLSVQCAPVVYVIPASEQLSNLY